jgi:CDP-glucose 4,6-dehydratase
MRCSLTGPEAGADELRPQRLHEASRLNLAWDKAFHVLGWQPRWDFTEAIRRTVEWYRQQLQSNVVALTLVQSDIQSYMATLHER